MNEREASDQNEATVSLEEKLKECGLSFSTRNIKRGLAKFGDDLLRLSSVSQLLTGMHCESTTIHVVAIMESPAEPSSVRSFAQTTVDYLTPESLFEQDLLAISEAQFTLARRLRSITELHARPHGGPQSLNGKNQVEVYRSVVKDGSYPAISSTQAQKYERVAP